MRWYEIINLSESSSGGSTSAGNVSTLVGNSSNKGSIGAGFNPNGDYGIYSKPKVKSSKRSSVIKREINK